MPQENEIYTFMKSNGLTQLDENAFLNKYSTPEKAKEIHSFMQQNDLTKLDESAFYDKYLKKKQSPQAIPVTGQRFALGGESTPQLPLTSQSKLAKKPIAKLTNIDPNKNYVKTQGKVKDFVAPISPITEDKATQKTFLSNNKKRNEYLENFSNTILDVANKVPESFFYQKNKPTLWGTKEIQEGTVNVDGVSKAIDLEAEKIQREQGVTLSSRDKQYLITNITNKLQTKKENQNAIAVTDAQLQKTFGYNMTDITGIKMPDGKVVKKGYFDEAKNKIEQTYEQEKNNLKQNALIVQKTLNVEFAPELEKAKQDVKNEAELKSIPINAEFDQLYKQEFDKYQSLVNSEQITVEQANVELEAKKNEIINFLTPKFEQIDKEAKINYNNATKEIQSRYNKKYQAVIKAQELAASQRIKKIQDEYSGKVPEEFLKTYAELLNKNIRYEFQKTANQNLQNFKNLAVTEKLGKAMMAGWSDVISTIGGAMGYAGFDMSSIAKITAKTGVLNPMPEGGYENASIFEKIADTDWWIANGVRALPFSITTMPVGIFGGVAAGTLAKVLGAAKRTQVISSVLGGGAVGWEAEAFLEAGGAYQQAINEGKSEEEASEIASNTMKFNLSTLPLNVLQMMPIFGGGFKALKVLEKPFLQGGYGTIEEILQGWSQAKANARQEGKDVDLFDYAMSPQAMEEGAIGFAMGQGMAVLSLDNTPDVDKQISTLMSSLSVGGEAQARKVLDIMKTNGAISEKEYNENINLLNYTLEGIKNVESFPIEDNLKASLVNKYVAIAKAKQLHTDDENDLASQASKEMVAEKEKEIKEILKGNEPVYLAFVKGSEVPIVTSKEEIDYILSNERGLEVFDLEVYNDESTNNKIQKAKEDLITAPQEITTEPTPTEDNGVGNAGVEPVSVEEEPTKTNIQNEKTNEVREEPKIRQREKGSEGGQQSRKENGQETNVQENEVLTEGGVKTPKSEISSTTEEKVSDALKDVESTAKALEGKTAGLLKEPTLEQRVEDLKNKNITTFSYEKEADVPLELRDKISSRGEKNGKKFINVTLSKVEADYLLSKDNPQAISEAYHNAKSKPEAQRSASDNELITSVETLLKPKEYATQEIKQPKSVRTEPEGGIKGGETAKTGVSDSVQRAKESEKEKVAEGGVTAPTAEPTETEVAQTAQKAGVTPKNLRDLYRISRDLFGQSKDRAFAIAIAMDRMIGAMAKRAGVTKEQIYGRLKFRKASEQDLPQGVKFQVDAWHGSPYQFDKFTTEKIGTGEGAQAFGWGLYFTDLESIARNYAKNLAITTFKGEKIDELSFFEKLLSGLDANDASFYNLDKGTITNLNKFRQYVKDTILFLEKELVSINKKNKKYQNLADKYTYQDLSVSDLKQDIDIYKHFQMVANESPDKNDMINKALPSFKAKADAARKMLLEINRNKKDRESILDSIIDYDLRRVKSSLNYYRYINDNFDKFNISRNLYKVSLHKGKTPDQYTWLEWDKPVSSKTKKSILDFISKDEKYTHQTWIEAKRKIKYALENDLDVTNEDLYKRISGISGLGQKEASLFLLDAGIDGVKYPAESIARGATSGNARGFNYVVFDENAVSIEEVIKFQKDAEKARGAVMIGMDGQAVIYAISDPNVSTPLHEMAHVFEHYLNDAERAAVQNWAGTKAWTTQTSEAFARGFEKYLAEGKAPNNSLQKIFDKFKTWLTDIYNGITGSDIDIELNEPMREIYAQMLGVDIQQTETSKPKPENVKAIEEAMTKKSGTIKNEIIKEAADPTEVKKILDNLDSIKSKLAGLTTKDGDSVFSEECKWG